MNDQAFDLAQFWLEGGASMYLVLLLAVVAEGCATIAIVTRHTVLAMVALALATLPLTTGVLGRAYNRMVVHEAIAHVNPADREMIETQGNKESDRPLQLGGVLTLLTLPTAAAALALSRKRRDP